MKATIEIPDELYRRVKSRSALLGRSVREVTTELYRQWLGERSADETSVAEGAWIDQWVSLGASVDADKSDDSALARDILGDDRSRLDGDTSHG